MLRLEKVSKDFGKFKLEDISFELKKGYIMGLMGHNGSGKTTIIKLIMNLLNVDSGNIYYMGEDIRKNLKKFKEEVGFVYDELYFYEHLKVKDFKNIVKSFYKNFDNNKFNNYLEKFNIDKNTKIRNLSKGQSIKLMLANALSHNAKLLVLDEPSSGLDPIFRKEMINIIQEELESGDKCAIFSTHILTDLEQCADYITLIKNGKLVLSESSEYIKENYKVIKGSKKELDDSNIDFIKREDNNYYSQGLFIENGYDMTNNISIATIEDIIYFMGRD
ncbi:ABC transporter ATP-binding protein [Romboutsia sp. 1001713B170131_170501_G6]|uniref:ABC transporter ATP-binding protein n=1 Tax=Romboutsia sp. 1001713B170131_170501_G6 TaxID=2787108 RepID=UPI0018A8C320|nr:ABC transporter ATP-binding protein [Romboutsia sp. 1001713B170131_170501_G6]